MLKQNKQNLSRVKNALVDGGYSGDPFAAEVKEILKATDGTPSHPLYLPSDLTPKPY
jgi:hypothetical protein